MTGFFNKLKHKLDPHSSSHPLAKQRDEFLSVDSTTPIEKKSHFTAEAVGAAAAYEAMKAFEHHGMHEGSGKVTHARGKEVIAGLAGGFAVKMVEEKGLPFTSNKDKEKFKVNASKYAQADSQRALRESGLYNDSELEPITEHEKHGHKIM